ncbi:myb-binding protein 1A-like protein [Branchiostoma floridae]|uniref:Myb-binding protein 1A-like protein n=1 Tax=Branchiostoma floridae TaxID=7739 RepID=A0A9J7LWN4_BRAFL|nr:myb-binding protein 1A-like protein [Branchiostoma floridae]
MATVDEHMADSAGIELRRPIRKEILDLFWEVAEHQDKRRLDAVKRLIGELKKTQDEYNASGENVPPYSPEIGYALNRLVHGLASSRKVARQGFSTALCELLHEVPAIPVEDVLQLIKKELQVAREERGAMFGELFGYLAVVQSGRLTDSPSETVVSVFKSLHGLRKHKPYLQHIGAQAIAQMFQQLSEETFTQHLYPHIREELQNGWSTCAPETLFLLLKVQQNFPGVVDKTFLKKHWGHKEIFRKENLESLGQVIMASATAHPNTHAVCVLILTRICKDKVHFPVFWDKIVDKTLCSASHERKLLAFKFLEHALPLLDAEHISQAMSPSLLKMLINNLVYPNSFHSAAAKQLCQYLARFVKSCSEADRQLAVLMALLHKPSTIHFDSVTKTQTVASIVGGLNAEAVLRYTAWLKKVFLTGTDSDEEVKEGSIESHRRWASNQLVHVVKNPSLTRTEQWLLDTTKFLFLHAFFKIKKPIAGDVVCDRSPAFELSQESSKLAAQHFNSVLSTLGTMPSFKQDGPKHALPGTRSNGDFWVYSLVQFADSLLNDTDHFEPLVQFPEEMMESWNVMLRNVEAMRKKTAKGCNVSESFQLLTLNLGIQMFTDADQVEEVLEEIQTCYEKATEKRRKSLKKGEEDEPHWVEVVVEILLSLLSRPSHLLRTVVDNVFRAVCPQLTRKGLQLILDVLGPKTEGDEEGHVMVEDLLTDEEEDGEDAEENEEDEEKIKLKPNGDLGSEDESDSDDDEEEEVQDVDEEFKAKIKEALGKAAAPHDDNDDNDDLSSTASGESDLSDSAMMKLDESLSKIFRTQRKSTKATKKEAKKLMTDFKQRVTDLLDIFLRKQPSNPLVLELVEPLLRIVQDSLRKSEEHGLAEKVAGLYRNKLCKIKDYPVLGESDSEELHAVLSNIVQVAYMAPSVYLVSLVSAGCMFLLRVLRGKTSLAEPSPVKTRSKRKKEKQAEDKSTGPEDPALKTGHIDVQKVVELYKSALENFMTRRDSHIHAVLFEDLVQHFPVLGWQLAEQLTAYITTGVQIYRRTQACHLLLRLMNTHQKPPDSQQWAAFVSGLSEKVGEVLHGVSQGVTEAKPKFLQEVLRTLQALIKAVEGDCKMLNDQLVDAVQHFSQQEVATRSSVITGLCKNCLKLMGHSTNLPTGKKGKKRKVSSDRQAPEDQSEETPSKKTKNSKQTSPDEVNLSITVNNNGHEASDAMKQEKHKMKQNKSDKRNKIALENVKSSNVGQVLENKAAKKKQKFTKVRNKPQSVSQN